MKKILSLILCYCCFFNFSYKVSAQEETPEIKAQAAFSIDCDTQQVLVDKDGDTLRPIASMTKMLSAYLILEAIHNGELSWEEEVSASEHAAIISEDRNLSNVPLKAGTNYTLRELFEAMIIYSANSATIALAEHYAGSEEAFVNLMKEQLEEWGISEYRIVSSSGLSNDLVPEPYWYPGTTAEDENYLSARSVAKVSLRLLEDFPEYLDFSNIPEKVFRPGQDEETRMINYNWLLPGLDFERPGVSGLKTGTTEAAGACISISAEENGRRVIAVIMNAGDGISNKSQRFEASKQILDYSFHNFENIEVRAKNLGLPSSYPIKYGKAERVGLNQVEEPSIITVRKDQDRQELISNQVVNPNLSFEDQALLAPVKADEDFARYQLPSFDYLYEEEASPQLTLSFSENVEEISTIEKIWQISLETLSDFVAWIVDGARNMEEYIQSSLLD